MNFILTVLLIAAGFCLSVMLLLSAFERKNMWTGLFGSILLITSAVAFVVVDSNESKVREAARAAQQLKDEELKVPVLFSEADGCKVYKYKDGGWHRFVRCSPKDVVIINTK